MTTDKLAFIRADIDALRESQSPHHRPHHSSPASVY